MNFKGLKQWERLDGEIDTFEREVKSDCAEYTIYIGILCGEYSPNCDDCPIAKFTGQTECQGTPFVDFEDNPCKETAQAMVDRLKEIRHKLFRLDR